MNKHNPLEQALDVTKRDMDRNRGLQHDSFAEALKKVSAKHGDKTKYWPRTYDSADTGDPYGYSKKPTGVPVWTKPPHTDEEKALYYGVHLHSDSNPLGLHTHVPGGKLTGGHSHGPQNRFGAHHHYDGTPEMAQVDGNHTHDGANHPDGGHEHTPGNFG
jgi:hypothetical protein